MSDDQTDFNTTMGLAMDRRTVMGVLSDLLDINLSGLNHLTIKKQRGEEDQYLEGIVSGLLIAFAVAVDGMGEPVEGDEVDVHALRDRGGDLMSGATHALKIHIHDKHTEN